MSKKRVKSSTLVAELVKLRGRKGKIYQSVVRVVSFTSGEDQSKKPPRNVSRRYQVACEKYRVPSIMISSLKEIDSILRNYVDDAVLFCKSPRPSACRKILQRLRFADSSEGIPNNRFNEVQGAMSSFSIGLDPESEVLNELRLENRHPFPVS